MAMISPNPRFDADPSQRRFAPLFRAGQAERSAFRVCEEDEASCKWWQLRSCRASIATVGTLRFSSGTARGTQWQVLHSRKHQTNRLRGT